MGLLEQIAEDKAALAAMTEEEVVDEQDEEEGDVVDDGEAEPEPEEKPPEEPEKPKEEPVKEPAKEEPLDAAGFARLRRELAAEKRARLELEAKLNMPAIQDTQALPQKEEPEPDEKTNPVAWMKWHANKVSIT